MSEKKKTNVLMMGVSMNFSTGMSKVGQYIFEGLSEYDDLDVYYFGIQNLGMVQPGSKILSLGQDPGGADMLEAYLIRYNIDVVVTILDQQLPQWSYMAKLFKKYNVRWICHVTVNSIPVFHPLYEGIKGADYWVAPTEFGVEQLKLTPIKDKENIRCIYHGVNTDIFKPLPRPPNQKFTFIAVGTNKPSQKNWLGLLKSFNHLVHVLGEKNVALKIVTEIGVEGGLDFGLAASQANIHDYVTLHPVIRNMGFDEKTMAEGLYNNADCYVTASFGESFGFPMLEAMACGVPAVASGFSAMGELIEKSNAGYACDYLMFPLVMYGAELGIPNCEDMAKQMQKMVHADEKEKLKLMKNAALFATQNDWRDIVPQWYELIKEAHQPVNNYETGELGI